MNRIGRGQPGVVTTPPKVETPAVEKKKADTPAAVPASTFGAQSQHPTVDTTALKPEAGSDAEARLRALIAPRAEPSPNFLLAAKVARFMDNAFPGATLQQIADGFNAATPGAVERFGQQDAASLAALQKEFAFMPQWSTHPAAQNQSWDWMSMPEAKNMFAEQLDRALEQLGQVSFDMDVTRGLGDRLAATKPFAKANVVMVQHALGQAYGLVDAMTKGGLDAKKSEYVFVPYQQAPAVKLTLGATFGMPVVAPQTGDIAAMYELIGGAVDRAYQRHKENGEPVLIVDDGGYASKWIAEHYPDDAKAFHVVEQTTRGLTEIAALAPKFPVVNVAGSYGKRLESEQIGDAIFTSVSKVLESMGRTANKKDVLVVGAGKVGLSTARAAVKHGAKNVAIFDPYLTAPKRRALEKEGFTVFGSKEEALKGQFLIIGASGHRSIEMQDILQAASKDPERPVFIATGSSKRVEIDHEGLMKAATDANGQLQKFLVAKVNEQETYAYRLQDGRMVTELADDLPVNFQGINSVAPEEIDGVMALMVTAAVQSLATTDAHGLVELDEAQQFDLQARKLGFRIGPGERGHDGELAMQLDGTRYVATQEQWMEVARSVGTPPKALIALFEAALAADAYELADACVAPDHEVPPELVDAVIRYGEETGGTFGYLPRFAKLLANEELPAERREQITSFLEEKLAGRLERMPARQRIEVPKGASVWTLAKLGALTKDPVSNLLGGLVLAHTHDTKKLKAELLADPKLLSLPITHNVYALQNPAWTEAELRTFAAKGLNALGGDGYARYAYDAWEAIASHPNASEDVRELATGQMDQFRPQLRGIAVGAENWPLDATLGVRAPDYAGIRLD